METLNNIQDYDLKMVQQYKQLTNQGFLMISPDQNIQSFQFVDILGITNLIVFGCKQLKFDRTPLIVQQLYVQCCKLESVNGIFQMSQLIELNLYDNNLNDIHQLKPLVNLQKLCIHDNKIVDISVIQFMVNLYELLLNNNQIIHVNALENLKQLQLLNIQENYIQDYSCIKHCRIQSGAQKMPTRLQILFSKKLKHIFDFSESKIKFRQNKLKITLLQVQCQEKLNLLTSQALNIQLNFTNNIINIQQLLQTCDQ
ncbi:Conserved_hypothetical protein [Hexamita inflata]|uniref:Leucine rich repeats-containing protein n=1 Tax=Hexamita inflata TaxID=28002 RepID=A0AA86UGE7_9EUKA|nr:Conserved hypothetical protein [Hexamita inflata]